MQRGFTYFRFIFIVVVFAHCTNNPNKAIEKSIEPKIEKSDSSPSITNTQKSETDLKLGIAKNFYTEYIKLVSSPRKDLELQRNKVLSKYCTSKLIQYLHDSTMSYDLVVNGQFADTSWLRNMQVKLLERDLVLVQITYYSAAQEKTIEKKYYLEMVRIEEDYFINSIRYKN